MLTKEQNDRLTLVGPGTPMGELMRRYWQPVALSSELGDLPKPIRILPYEWVTQFGHIALLDSYLKMARLGMYPDANYVVLAPKDKVVKQAITASGWAKVTLPLVLT